MYHFKYVTKAELAPFKKELIELIHLVQNDVRDDFTFQYEFIGSVSRNMVTFDPQSNTGFDFDVNLFVNDDEEDYKPGEIKHILMDAFNTHARKYRYDFARTALVSLQLKLKTRKTLKFSIVAILQW